MTISRQSWDNYISRLRQLNNIAADKILQYINAHGVSDTRALIEYAYAVATKYGEGAAAITAAMYDSIAESEKASVPSAEMANTATYSEVAKTVNGTLKTGNPEIVSSSIGTLVKKAGADTMLYNAIRDSKKAEFAWIPSGDSCAFCMTLASNGWKTASKDLLKNGHAEHIHANCDCNFAIRFNESTNIEGYDPDKYLEMYQKADGYGSKEKINSMRREIYAKNKDQINAQKRMAYAERKLRDNDR